MILCFALGIANIFHFHWVILFSVLCLYVSPSPYTPTSSDHSLRTSNPLTRLYHPYRVSCFIVLFIEIPFLLRICPTSPGFDAFIRRFETNYMRAAIYLVLSVIQWLSLIASATSLIVCAVFLLIAACFYALAGVRGQACVNSKTLGGQGVAQMIV